MQGNSVIKRIFTWTTLTVVAVTAISFLRMHSLVKASESVNHTNMVKENLGKLGWNMTSVESNQRGYLLTRDSSFLNLRAASIVELDRNLTFLDSLIADNPTQVAAAERLRKRLYGRIAALDAMLVTNPPVIDSSLRQKAIEGKRLMDGIRKEIGGMTLVENLLLESRTQNFRRQLIIAPATILILSLIALIILLWSFRRLTRAINNSVNLQNSQRQMSEMIAQKNRELQASNQDMEKQNRNLEKMNEELESFAYIAGHDLQEPLRKIQIFSKRIVESKTSPLSAESAQDFERIERSVKRMQRLINDLLSYSRTSRGEQYFQQTDLNSVIEQVREELADKLAAQHASLIVEKLPTALVIPFQIKQLFTNLIENSLKFSRKDVDPIIQVKFITITGSSNEYAIPLGSGKYYQISIRDNGIGFEEEYSEKIFGVFQRLHGRKEYEGTGIGLSIVKKIAENHFGTVIARARPGEGAEFILFLPAATHD